MIFGGALLLATRIGAEFMPHLDEGALWVRATMPSTISLDESAQAGAADPGHPHSRFPKSPTSRRSTAARMTAPMPTGFFNAEFFVGLKPYREWTGPYRTKAELIAAINKKLIKFPGIEFNYTQPAEDAVDEAETGLKSSLAVKVFGTDLHGAGAEGRRKSSAVLEHGAAASTASPWCTSSASRASPCRSIAPRSRSYGINAGDVNNLISSAVGGVAATQRRAGRTAPSTWSSACSRSSARRRSRSARS